MKKSTDRRRIRRRKSIREIKILQFASLGAGGLFVKSRNAETTGQLGFHVRPLDFAVCKHHKKVIQQVRCFMNQMSRAVGTGFRGGFHNLGRFFPYLTADSFDACGQEIDGIRSLWRVGLPLLDDVEQLGDHMVRHWMVPASGSRRRFEGRRIKAGMTTIRLQIAVWEVGLCVLLFLLFLLFSQFANFVEQAGHVAIAEIQAG